MHKTHTQMLVAVATMFLPFTAMAAVKLDASDSVAGIGLTIEMQGANSGEQIDIAITDPDGSTMRIPVKADAEGKAVAMMPGLQTQAAGTYNIQAMQKGNTILSTVQVEVHPDSVDASMSEITAFASNIRADGRDQTTVDITLRDQFGNVLPRRPVSLIASRKSDKIVALSPQTDETGMQQFSIRTTEAGTIQLRAIDLLSTITIDDSATIQAEGAIGGNAYAASAVSNQKYYFNAQAAPSFDVIDHFEIGTEPEYIAADEGAKVTVRAVDQNGNQVRNYTGTIRFLPIDSETVYPSFGQYTFLGINQGLKKFDQGLVYRTEGIKTLRVEDINDPSIFGEIEVVVGEASSIDAGKNGDGKTGAITITSFKSGDYVNTLDIVIEGMAPSLSNLIVLGGTEDVRGTSDERGAFSIPITLSAGKRDYTIRVQESTGRNDSGPLDLILDQDAPTIDLIQFAPENPKEGEKILVVVQGEPHLSQAMFNVPDRINGKPNEIILTENPNEPGSYQGFFTAPAPDTYHTTVTVQDVAGNITDLSAQLTISGKTLPKVLNVKAEPKIDAIELTWDPLPGNMDGYRIYIGDSENNYLYTLDTGKVTTKATVKGLTQGQQYTFAVTALRGDMESEAKSDPVRAIVLGFKLEVTPGDGALRVTWTTLASDLPLSSFTLSYGTTETDLTESRILHGNLRDTTIRDLLNGVPYFIRIVPVTITGDTLDELAAVGEGTPNGAGFKPGARDDVPFNIPNLPEGPLHSGAPANPESGIPAVAWMTLTAIATAGVFFRWRHRQSLQQTAAFMQAIQSHYGKS